MTHDESRTDGAVGRVVYSTSVVIDAHMVCGFLAEHGVDAIVHGDSATALGPMLGQGAARVEVRDADAARATELIRAWERGELSDPPGAPSSMSTAQTSEKEPEPEPTIDGVSSLRLWTSCVVACAVGAAVMWVFIRATPVETPTSVEEDRNHDGAIDSISYFDEDGIYVGASVDHDFDGAFEESWSVRPDGTLVGDIDFEGDQGLDRRYICPNSVCLQTEFYDAPPRNLRTVECNPLGGGRFQRTDLDGDGVLETHIDYDHHGVEQGRRLAVGVWRCL